MRADFCGRVLRVWTVPVVVVAAFVVGCFGGSGGGGDDGSGLSGDGPAPIEAGEPATSYGVGWYEDFYAETTTQTDVAVTVASPEGAVFGVLRISYNRQSELVATFTSHTGEVASYRAWSDVDVVTGEMARYEEVGADGRIVRTTAITGTQIVEGAADEAWVRDVVVSTPLPAGAVAPSVGGIAAEATGGLETAALVLVADGLAVASEPQMQTWTSQTGIADLSRDPAALLLQATLRDPNLFDAVAEALGSLGVRESEGSLRSAARASHNVEVCGLVDTIIASDPNAFRRRACGVCVNNGAAVDLFMIFDGLVICHACSVSIGLGLEHLFACALARVSADVWTDDRCRAELPAPGNGAILLATADGHGCQAICAPDACESLCSGLFVPRGIPYASQCGGVNDAVCACRPDPETACTQRAGASYCGGSSLTEYTLDCPQARCGDATITSSCPNAPALQEVCDVASVPTGCAAQNSCALDCLSCQSTCQCTPGASPDGCSAGLTCNANCQCEPAPNDCAGRVGASPRSCNPAAGAAACPAGTVCDPGSCECTYCGDDIVNGAETCEPGVSGADCPAEQSCVDCRCVSNCGNGRVDPGEHCDPAGGPACDAGYRCESCTCVEATATCGDGICDRVGGETEASCAGDCPLVCGDGRCNVTGGETAATCPTDCSSGEVACCVQTSGCPTEELYSCPGDCCCCGSGERCVRHAATWICGM